MLKMPQENINQSDDNTRDYAILNFGTSSNPQSSIDYNLNIKDILPELEFLKSPFKRMSRNGVKYEGFISQEVQNLNQVGLAVRNYVLSMCSETGVKKALEKLEEVKGEIITRHENCCYDRRSEDKAANRTLKELSNLEDQLYDLEKELEVYNSLSKSPQLGYKTYK